MAPYYPVFLDLKGKPCVIIGGGEVAERKIQYLLECQATLTIISPEVTPGIKAKADSGEIRWLERKYIEGDLDGVVLAIAATDQRAVNIAIAEEASKKGVVLNVVDDAALCTFIAPAVVRQGEVTVALSTGGASPALARKLRESLEGNEVLEYAHLTGILSSARKELKRRRVTVHPDRWQECISSELVSMVKAGQEEQALRKLMADLLEGTQHEARTPA
jgi:precorrin-2 dehydrogenase/sirohydrochlorin ferrochelatase